MNTGRTKADSDLLEQLPNGALIEMILVEGGTFQMGSNEYSSEKPIHKVAVPDFCIGKFPVTTRAYLEFAEATRSHYPEWLEEGSAYNIQTGTEGHYKKLGAALTNDHHPIIRISWNDAVAYCQWLSRQSGKEYRLPSEAEWEYAARGGNKSLGFRFAGSNKLKEVGWYNLNSHGETKPAGLKLPNELGLYDMSGNVFEWCADHWHGNYEGAPNDGRAWVGGGDSAVRVVRGGSWFNGPAPLPPFGPRQVPFRSQERQYRFSFSPVLTLEHFYPFTL